MTNVQPSNMPPPVSAARRDPKNVQGVERMLSIGLGAGALIFGARRGGFSGAALALAGATLLARGVAGSDPVKLMLTPSPAAKDAAERYAWNSAAIVNRAVTINRPREEVYAAFRDFSQLPRFMTNVHRIEVSDEKRSHWVVKGPGGVVEWNATITEDEPGRRIAWKSDDDADVRNAGAVDFIDAPGGRGVEVHAVIAFEAPGGAPARILAALMNRDPALQTRQDLRRFKQWLETGELATAKGPEAAPAGGKRASEARQPPARAHGYVQQQHV